MSVDAPLVECLDLTRHYQQGENIIRALDGVSFEVRRGDFIAIMGPSGSGKSTLMHLLGCLDQPSAGRLRIAGQDVSAVDDAELSRFRNHTIGFVFQAFHLLGQETILENVALPLMYYGLPVTERRARAAALLGAVGLAERTGHTPLELSGGQCQRAAIARALVNKPSLLLADEPTGNLDSRTSLEILWLFQKLNEWGMTIVMVTHDREVAACTRAVLTMRDGRMVSLDSVVDRRLIPSGGLDVQALEELMHAAR